MKCSEFSFILGPSTLGGIGVFATHDFENGERILDFEFRVRTIKKCELPTVFHKYGIHKNDEEFFCPIRFDCMEIGWFINHSEQANVILNRDEQKKDNNTPESFIALTCKKICAGEEIFVNYRQLDEPRHLWEPYYAGKKTE